MNWSDAVLTLMTFAVAASTPGPANLAIMATSMAQGRRSGLMFGLGLTVGLAFWGVLAGFGLGTLLATWAPGVAILKLLGAAYLIFLAVVLGRSAMRAKPETIGSSPSRHYFTRGLLLNLTNPKAILAWVAALSIGVPADASAASIWFLFAGCSLVGLVNYAIYASVFSLRPLRAAYYSSRRGIEGACAALFALAGLKLLVSRAP